MAAAVAWEAAITAAGIASYHFLTTFRASFSKRKIRLHFGARRSKSYCVDILK